MSNYNYGLNMNGSNYDQTYIPYNNYKFISVINNTDNIIEVYQEKRITSEPAAMLIKILPYTALTVPIDNRSDFSFIYTDGGGASPKRAQVIFSTENLMYSGVLGTQVTGSMIIAADGVGLAKQAQLPAALGASGGVKVEIVDIGLGATEANQDTMIASLATMVTSLATMITNQGTMITNQGTMITKLQEIVDKP